jgi:hypothetical protein
VPWFGCSSSTTRAARTQVERRTRSLQITLMSNIAFLGVSHWLLPATACFPLSQACLLSCTLCSLRANQQRLHWQHFAVCRACTPQLLHAPIQVTAHSLLNYSTPRYTPTAGARPRELMIHACRVYGPTRWCDNNTPHPLLLPERNNKLSTCQSVHLCFTHKKVGVTSP